MTWHNIAQNWPSGVRERQRAEGYAKPMDHDSWQKDAAARCVREQNPDHDYPGPVIGRVPPAHAASESPGEP
jgi:hypothetical protein